jgi:hypothetical protein
VARPVDQAVSVSRSCLVATRRCVTDFSMVESCCCGCLSVSNDGLALWRSLQGHTVVRERGPVDRPEPALVLCIEDDSSGMAAMICGMRATGAVATRLSSSPSVATKSHGVGQQEYQTRSSSVKDVCDERLLGSKANVYKCSQFVKHVP